MRLYPGLKMRLTLLINRDVMVVHARCRDSSPCTGVLCGTSLENGRSENVVSHSHGDPIVHLFFGPSKRSGLQYSLSALVLGIVTKIVVVNPNLGHVSTTGSHYYASVIELIIAAFWYSHYRLGTCSYVRLHSLAYNPADRRNQLGRHCYRYNRLLPLEIENRMEWDRQIDWSALEVRTFVMLLLYNTNTDLI